MRYPLIEVTWRDASLHSLAWTLAGDAATATDLTTCKVVGYRVFKDEHRSIFAMGYCVDNMRFSGLWTIPTRDIVKVRRLGGGV